MPEAVTMPRLMMMTSMGKKNRWTNAAQNRQDKQIEQTQTDRQTDRQTKHNLKTDRHKSRHI